MKELSIEEQAKRYDEAFEIARLELQERGNEPDGASILSKLFPELKDSEDEKINKEIIDYLIEHDVDGYLLHADCEKWVAYLENIGEHKKFRDSIKVGDKVTRNEDGVLVNLSQLNRVAKKDEQILANSAKTCKDEQKPADKIQIGKIYKCIASPRYSTFIRGELYMPEDEFLCSLMNFCSDCFEPIEDGEHKLAKSRQETKPNGGIVGEYFKDGDGYYKVNLAYLNKSQVEFIESLVASWQNPTNNASAWSEEDKRLEKCVGVCLTGISEQRFDDFKTSLKECLDWLHSLKDRMWYQPIQEWSEEDKAHIDSLLKRLEGMCKPGATFTSTGFAISEDEDWLKSLRPQNRWKPSDEQIMALRWVLNHIPYDSHKEEISGLLEQLKKLK